MSLSDNHIHATKINRQLQKKGRFSLYKQWGEKLGVVYYEGEEVSLSESKRKSASTRRNRKIYIQLGVVFVIFVILWWILLSL